MKKFIILDLISNMMPVRELPWGIRMTDKEKNAAYFDTEEEAEKVLYYLIEKAAKEMPDRRVMLSIKEVEVAKDAVLAKWSGAEDETPLYMYQIKEERTGKYFERLQERGSKVAAVMTEDRATAVTFDEEERAKGIADELNRVTGDERIKFVIDTIDVRTNNEPVMMALLAAMLQGR
jgi:hypothetical protein